MVTIPYCFTTTFSVVEKTQQCRIVKDEVLTMTWGKNYVCIINHWFRKNSK